VRFLAVSEHSADRRQKSFTHLLFLQTAVLVRHPCQQLQAIGHGAGFDVKTVSSRIGMQKKREIEKSRFILRGGGHCSDLPAMIRGREYRGHRALSRFLPGG
jgi:hypothetical protein